MTKGGHPVVSRMLMGALHGVGWGAIVVVGYVSRSLGFGSRPTGPFGQEILLGMAFGATIGPLIVLLQPLSQRGLLGHYAPWIIACVCASSAIMVVLDKPYDSTSFFFGAFMGFCAGLGMGAITRKPATS